VAAHRRKTYLEIRWEMKQIVFRSDGETQGNKASNQISREVGGKSPEQIPPRKEQCYQIEKEIEKRPGKERTHRRGTWHMHGGA